MFSKKRGGRIVTALTNRAERRDTGCFPRSASHGVFISLGTSLGALPSPKALAYDVAEERCDVKEREENLEIRDTVLSEELVDVEDSLRLNSVEMMMRTSSLRDLSDAERSPVCAVKAVRQSLPGVIMDRRRLLLRKQHHRPP